MYFEDKILRYMGEGSFEVDETSGVPIIDRGLVNSELHERCLLFFDLYVMLQQLPLKDIFTRANIPLRSSEQVKIGQSLLLFRGFLKAYLQHYGLLQKKDDSVDEMNSIYISDLLKEIITFLQKTQVGIETGSERLANYGVQLDSVLATSKKVSVITAFRRKARQLHWGWHVAAGVGVVVGAGLIIAACVAIPPMWVLPLIAVGVKVKILALAVGIFSLASTSIIHSIRIGFKKSANGLFRASAKSRPPSPVIPPSPPPKFLQDRPSPEFKRQSSGFLRREDEDRTHLRVLLARWKLIYKDSGTSLPEMMRCLLDVELYAKRAGARDTLRSTHRNMHLLLQQSRYRRDEDGVYLTAFHDGIADVMLRPMDSSEAVIPTLSQQLEALDINTKRMRPSSVRYQKLSALKNKIEDLTRTFDEIRARYVDHPGNFHLGWLVESYQLFSDILSDAATCLEEKTIPISDHETLWSILGVATQQKQLAVEMMARYRKDDSREREAAIALQDFQKLMGRLRDDETLELTLTDLKQQQMRANQELVSTKVTVTVDDVQMQYIGGGANAVYLLTKTVDGAESKAILRVYVCEEHSRVRKALRAVEGQWQNAFMGGRFLEYQTDLAMYQLSEFFDNGDLTSVISRLHRPGYQKTALDSQLMLKHFRQIVDIYARLHANNPPIVFSDIKPGNLYLDDHNNIMLSDLKSLYALTDEQVEIGVKVQDLLYTDEYRAPEVANEHREEGYRYAPFPADCYSLGLTMCEYITGTRDPEAINGYNSIDANEELIRCCIVRLLSDSPATRTTIPDIQDLLAAYDEALDQKIDLPADDRETRLVPYRSSTCSL